MFLNGHRKSLLGALALSVFLVTPAAAQGGFGGPGGRFGGGATPPNPAAQQAAETMESIILLRVLAEAKLSRETLEKIRDLLAGGFSQLATGDAETAGELAKIVPDLEKSKAAIRAKEGLDVPTPEEIVLAGEQQRLLSARQNFLNQLTEQVRQLLQSLSPEERAAALIAAAALVRAQRAAQIERFAGAGQGGFGGAARTARSFDGLRNASPQRYQRERMEFAMRSAGIRGGFGGDRGRGGPGGGPGFQGGRRGGPGGGDQGPNMNDPAIQARMAPYLRMADQIRSMSPAQYQQSRDRMAAQAETQRNLERINAPVSEQEASEALLRALVRKSGLETLVAKVGKAPAPVAGAG